MSSTQDQLPKQLSSSADEVETLARVLRAQYWGEDRWDGEILNANKEDWLGVARAAIAHTRKRPEGLPTAEEIGRVSYWSQSPGSPDWDWSVTGNAILSALAPWLREPVGWELDVTAEEMYDKWNDFTCDEERSFQAVLDLCRSRIRPTFECKECADNKRLADAAIISERVATARINAARAALEDE